MRVWALVSAIVVGLSLGMARAEPSRDAVAVASLIFDRIIIFSLEGRLSEHEAVIRAYRKAIRRLGGRIIDVDMFATLIPESFYDDMRKAAVEELAITFSSFLTNEQLAEIVSFYNGSRKT